MNTVESKYVEKKGYLSRYTHERAVTLREVEGLQWMRGYESEEHWLRCVLKEFPLFIPFLEHKRGVVFRGRILEIGAGGAWSTMSIGASTFSSTAASRLRHSAATSGVTEYMRALAIMRCLTV